LTSKTDIKTETAKQSQPNSASTAPRGEEPHKNNPLWQSFAIRPAAIQTKLTVSQPGDSYELEADRVADRVMRMETSAVVDPKAPDSPSGSRNLQRSCSGHNAEGDGETEHIGPIPGAVRETLSTSGRPLDSPSRSFFEPRLHQDLGDVRVHADAQAEAAASSVSARAFTLGRDVVFAAGEYAPGSRRGRELLAHELVHVAQQRGGSAPDRQDPTTRAEQFSSSAHITPSSAPAVIARQPKGAGTAKPKPKPPPTVKLFDKEFVLHKDSTTGAFDLRPAKGGTAQWTFTPGPISVATRTLPRWAYVHASGVSDPIRQQAVLLITPGHAAQAGTAATGTTPAVPPVPEVGDKVEKSGPIIAVFSGSTLGLLLDDGQKVTAPRKTETVVNASVERLDFDLKALGFQPVEGDMLTFGLESESFVFAKIGGKEGFFDAGKFVLFERLSKTGLTGPQTSVSQKQKAFDVLLGAGKITASEAAVFKPLSEIEGGFAEVQNYDAGVLSFGYAQWTVHSDLAAVIELVPPAVLQQYLGQLTAQDPEVATEQFFKKFIPNFAAEKLTGFHAKKEGSFSLGGKEVLPPALIQTAVKWQPKLAKLSKDALAARTELIPLVDALDKKKLETEAKRVVLAAATDELKAATKQVTDTKAAVVKAQREATRHPVKAGQPAAQAAAAGSFQSLLTVANGQAAAAKLRLEAAKPKVLAAKTDLASARTAEKAAQDLVDGLAKTKLRPLIDGSKGLPGVVAGGDPRERADKLVAALAAAELAAQRAAGSVSEEELRKPEWVLRFQLLGQEQDVQAAEVKSAQARLKALLDEKWTAAPNGLLLRSNRGHALLLSNFYNAPTRSRAAFASAVRSFAQAKGTAAAWKGFPWAAGDARWSAYTDAEEKIFIDAHAMPAMLAVTEHPDTRKRILNSIPD